jgi:transposase InsO family protein
MQRKKMTTSMTWESFRFSVIGPLLTRPPSPGELGKAIKKLAEQPYEHPVSGEWVTFGASTIERWYYKALNSDDPVAELRRKTRKDNGSFTAMSPELFEVLKKQYGTYPNWSYQLHTDNLAARIKQNPSLGNSPSCSTVTRHMKRHGLIKKKTVRNKTPGQLKAEARLESRESRGYEAEYINELWHLDFHHGKRIVDTDGTWVTPKALCVMDDASRLVCHLQWFTDETAGSLIHGLSQAFYKRGLPRSLMTDNGAAMIASETVNGLEKLGILHKKTLPYSPEQNGKQETFWGSLEGRLMNMLSNVEDLKLDFLNQATQAWVEMEYNKKNHDGISTSPIEKFIGIKNVARPSPSAERLRFFFTSHVTRRQRRSDGTLQIDGVRYEVPSRFRHIHKLNLRYQTWDLSCAYIVDEKTGDLLARITPEDKQENASGKRRTLEPFFEPVRCPSEDPVPPLLKQLLEEFSATGLPAAYIPQPKTIK